MVPHELFTIKLHLKTGNENKPSQNRVGIKRRYVTIKKRIQKLGNTCDI